jgi:MOSC domain-containing protein YiiM
MGEVAHLFLARQRGGAMQEVASVDALADQGFRGCIHGRPGSRRQVLLIDEETLAALGLEPGAVRENVTTRRIQIMGLAAGRRIRIGGALLEATIPCTPCHRMDEIRMGLQEQLRGRRGMLFRVVAGGPIRLGDAIRIETTDGGQP